MTNSKEGTGEPMSPCGHHFGDPDALCNCPCPACTKAGTGAEPETDAVAAKKCWYCGLYIDLGQPGPCALSQSGFHYTRDVSSPAAAEAVEPCQHIPNQKINGRVAGCLLCGAELPQPASAGGDVDAAANKWADSIIAGFGDPVVKGAGIIGFKAGVAFARGEGNE